MKPLNQIEVAPDATHHVFEGVPLYSRRFIHVLKYHPPGLAPVCDHSGAYHIDLNGDEAYQARFNRTFGFYEGLATVEGLNGWFHVLPSGQELYADRYSWCGNFQGGRAVVRDCGGHYFHINQEGKRVYSQNFLYAGDFRDGVACARRMDGLCVHIGPTGRQIHNGTFLDLDVFHKGLARARDEWGWLHIDLEGRQAYTSRHAEVEPFYNGQAHVLSHDGKRFIIEENGRTVRQVWNGRVSTKTSPKLIFVVMGNIGSGKSTLIKGLVECFGGKTASIDEFRCAYGDGSSSGEIRAWLKLVEAIERQSISFVEFSGSGPFVHLLKLALKKSYPDYAVLWLQAPASTCLQRAPQYKAQVPYPDFGVPLARVIEELQTRLQAEIAASKTWSCERVHILDASLPAAEVLRTAVAVVATLLKAKGSSNE